MIKKKTKLIGMLTDATFQQIEENKLLGYEVRKVDFKRDR